MMTDDKKSSEVDELVTETRQLRYELMKNAAKLQAFADQLAHAAALLLEEVGKNEQPPE